MSAVHRTEPLNCLRFMTESLRDVVTGNSSVDTHRVSISFKPAFIWCVLGRHASGLSPPAGGLEFLEAERRDADRPTERPVEGFPSHGGLVAFLNRVEPGTSAGYAARGVDHHLAHRRRSVTSVSGLADVGFSGCGGQCESHDVSLKNLPTTADTGPDRDHDSLPPRGGHRRIIDAQVSQPTDAAESPGHWSADATASETMSMRHPVSLAARRAFWPSLPMASES